MTGKGFLSTTAALLTGIGTMLAAMVALAILLFGEGLPFKGDSEEPAGPGAVGGGSVRFQEIYGYDGTSGIELDGDNGIIRNPARDPDIMIFPTSERLGAYSGGAMVLWTGAKAPTRDECDKALETHGASGTFDMEIASRFCVRSSGGRTAYLAVISDGQEYQVSVWK